MTTVTGLTADRMLTIEGSSVVDGDVVGNNLILTKHNGQQINAGNVRGPVGPAGATGPVYSPPFATTLPASPKDGQQVVWTPDNTAFGANNTIAWLMMYQASTSRWVYLGGSPARSGSTGAAWTYAPTTSTVNKPNPQDKYGGGKALTLPNAGYWNVGLWGGTVRGGTGNSQQGYSLTLGLAVSYNSGVLVAYRESSFLWGPSDGFVFKVETVLNITTPGDQVGPIVQAAAVTAGQGFVFAEASGLITHATPESIIP